ncbi:Exonuclease [Eumeta japonica]|uniref:Exonuclease n=1 Tax=Eumeta variegata TaxID=151549 RepID=A0A4C1VV19_EUMVA|nr:Exonuclease [Eumeta japonica]
MEQGFIKANSSNLPRIDLLMLGEFFTSNNDFVLLNFDMLKLPCTSSRPSYGDDAVSYVQLKRDGKICTVKGKICPEHKVHAKLYAITLVVDEEEEAVVSVQCHDCVASKGDLVLKYKEKSCETFLQKIVLSNETIAEIEEETKEQHQNSLWFELRYGRITASRAFEFSRCKKNDGSLMALIMGGSIPDTRVMKRGRLLENEVRKTVGKKLGKKIKKCGLMLSKEYPMIAGSPDGICENSIIEIKCPTSAKTYQNYINNGKPTEKFNTQMQMQMYLTGLQKGYFCVADSNYSTNKKVEIISVTYDETYMSDFLKLVVDLWKENVPSVISKLDVPGLVEPQPSILNEMLRLNSDQVS